MVGVIVFDGLRIASTFFKDFFFIFVSIALIALQLDFDWNVDYSIIVVIIIVKSIGCFDGN